MSPRDRDNLLAVLLTVVIGLFGAVALANWAACEADDSFCAFTGSTR